MLGVLFAPLALPALCGCTFPRNITWLIGQPYLTEYSKNSFTLVFFTLLLACNLSCSCWQEINLFLTFLGLTKVKPLWPKLEVSLSWLKSRLELGWLNPTLVWPKSNLLHFVNQSQPSLTKSQTNAINAEILFISSEYHHIYDIKGIWVSILWLKCR